MAIAKKTVPPCATGTCLRESGWGIEISEHELNHCPDIANPVVFLNRAAQPRRTVETAKTCVFIRENGLLRSTMEIDRKSIAGAHRHFNHASFRDAMQPEGASLVREKAGLHQGFAASIFHAGCSGEHGGSAF
jgi:hypothetical protein